MTNYPYATSASIKNCTIATPQGTNTKDITDLVMRFDYFENIDYPSTHAKLQLQDSGANIISSYPIQGFEKIVLTFEVGEDNEFEYEFRINKIRWYSRISRDGFFIHASSRTHRVFDARRGRPYR